MTDTVPADAGPPALAAPAACPVCGASTEAGQAFCESCGPPLQQSGPATAAPEGLTVVEQDAPIELTRPTAAVGAADEALVPATRCLSCAGEVGEDGYCMVCGT